MTAGDVVSGISGDNATLDYQPAAGVEAVIKSVFATNTGMNNLQAGTVGLYDGTTFVTLGYNTLAGGMGEVNGQCNIFVNNTRYLRLLGVGVGRFTGFTGIQTK